MSNMRCSIQQKCHSMKCYLEQKSALQNPKFFCSQLFYSPPPPTRPSNLSTRPGLWSDHLPLSYSRSKGRSNNTFSGNVHLVIMTWKKTFCLRWQHWLDSNPGTWYYEPIVVPLSWSKTEFIIVVENDTYVFKVKILLLKYLRSVKTFLLLKLSSCAYWDT